MTSTQSDGLSSNNNNNGEVVVEEKSNDHERPKLIDDVAGHWITIVFLVITLSVLSTIGSVANVINIIVFLRQGFKDTMNISLLGLAVSDLGALLTCLWLAICFNPLFRYSGIPFESGDINYFTAGWPHVCFARITSWITAFITFERCLCIALPLKVKNILTPKVTGGIIVAIFVIMFLSVSPVFYVIRYGPVFYPMRNATLIGLVYINNGRFIENISFSFNVFSQLSSFAIVIIGTAILIRSLVIKSKWRRTASQASISGSKDSMATRDKKIVIMVTFISCIFIFCFLPTAVNLVPMMCFAPEYGIVGRYQNSFRLIWGIIFNLESANSSVNIIIYYRMSSKYRAMLQGMFCTQTEDD